MIKDVTDSALRTYALNVVVNSYVCSYVVSHAAHPRFKFYLVRVKEIATR